MNSFTEAYAQSLSADCDLDLWPSDIVNIGDTSSSHNDHLLFLAKLFSNPPMHDKIMQWTWTSFTEACAQSLSADFDLDLWPTNMVLVHDISSCHDDHLCQIIFKSHHAWQSYGPNTNSFTEAYAQS